MITGTAIAAKAHKNKGETNVIVHKNTNLKHAEQTPACIFSRKAQALEKKEIIRRLWYPFPDCQDIC
jgi:hypothetical protein